MRVCSPLENWVYGSLALVRDVRHPTPPPVAQGAAQVIEDAAVLAVVPEKCPDTKPGSTKKMSRIKQRRNRDFGSVSCIGRKSIAFACWGSKGRERKKFAALKENKGAVPDKCAQAHVQTEIHGHNCALVAEEQFDALFAKMKPQL